MSTAIDTIDSDQVTLGSSLQKDETRLWNANLCVLFLANCNHSFSFFYYYCPYSAKWYFGIFKMYFCCLSYKSSNGQIPSFSSEFTLHDITVIWQTILSRATYNKVQIRTTSGTSSLTFPMLMDGKRILHSCYLIVILYVVKQELIEWHNIVPLDWDSLN